MFIEENTHIHDMFHWLIRVLYKYVLSTTICTHHSKEFHSNASDQRNKYTKKTPKYMLRKMNLKQKKVDIGYYSEPDLYSDRKERLLSAHWDHVTFDHASECHAPIICLLNQLLLVLCDHVPIRPSLYYVLELILLDEYLIGFNEYKYFN